ncbi:unnamed protein product [Lathyrus sativus]|nr:unnamed protein product [Lathyrus sativus]
MLSFGLVSTQTQYLMAKMLSDDEFVDKFLAESAKRLAQRYRVFTAGLIKVGIKCLQSNGGLFVWMDLRGLLKNATFKSELKLWRVIIHEVKINVSPGVSFHCSEPGWFRVCYANMDDRDVQIALQRIRSLVTQNNKEAMVSDKNSKPCWHSNLRLSLKSRRFDDIMMSPHSPIPQSPFMKATT